MATLDPSKIDFAAARKCVDKGGAYNPYTGVCEARAPTTGGTMTSIISPISRTSLRRSIAPGPTTGINPFPSGPTAFPSRNGGTSRLDVAGGIRGGIQGLQGSNGGGSWVDALIGGVAGLLGGGSEPPTGDAPVPGLAAPPPTGGFQPCPEGAFRLPGGKCVKPSAALPGGEPFVSDAFGEAVLGMHGVALTPAVQERVRLRCPRGMVLGTDDLCYNRRDLRKSDRKWVPPRKPLLTGGDLNAISRASRAASRLERQTKRLQKLGMIKKPTRRAPRRAARSAQKGITVIDTD